MVVVGLCDSPHLLQDIQELLLRTLPRHGGPIRAAFRFPVRPPPPTTGIIRPHYHGVVLAVTFTTKEGAAAAVLWGGGSDSGIRLSPLSDYRLSAAEAEACRQTFLPQHPAPTATRGASSSSITPSLSSQQYQQRMESRRVNCGGSRFSPSSRLWFLLCSDISWFARAVVNWEAAQTAAARGDSTVIREELAAPPFFADASSGASTNTSGSASPQSGSRSGGASSPSRQGPGAFDALAAMRATYEKGNQPSHLRHPLKALPWWSAMWKASKKGSEGESATSSTPPPPYNHLFASILQAVLPSLSSRPASSSTSSNSTPLPPPVSVTTSSSALSPPPPAPPPPPPSLLLPYQPTTSAATDGAPPPSMASRYAALRREVAATGTANQHAKRARSSSPAVSREHHRPPPLQPQPASSNGAAAPGLSDTPLFLQGVRPPPPLPQSMLTRPQG